MIGELFMLAARIGCVPDRVPDLRIIIASGYSSGSALGDDAVEGANYLAKPYMLDQLRSAMENA